MSRDPLPTTAAIMVFPLSVLAGIQIAFLPGYLVLRSLRSADGALQTLILGLSLSLVINHLLVCFLVLLGIYGRNAVGAIVLTELLLLVFLRRHAEPSYWSGLCVADAQRIQACLSAWQEASGSVQVLTIIAAAAATLSIAYIVLAAVNDFGAVFSAWDPVVSWNRWALDWAHNRPAEWTSHYPQLIPTAWSLTYVTSGSLRIQFFAKELMWLFPLGVLLMNADLALRLMNPAYLVAIPIAAVALQQMSTDLASGYVDLVVGFMWLSALYVWLLAPRVPLSSRQRYLAVGAACAAGAFLTKQSGALAVATYGVLSAQLLVSKSGFSAQTFKRWLAFMLLATLLCLPWYIYKEVQMFTGADWSEANSVLTQVHQGRDYLQRVAYAVAQLARVAGSVWVLVAYAAAVTLSLTNQRWRWIILASVPAGFLAWALFLSYDVRNLIVLVPLTSTAAGIGIWAGLRYVGMRLRVVSPKIESTIVAITLLALPFGLAFHPALSDDSLRLRQTQRQREVGDPNINRVLYRMYDEHRLTGTVLTNYQLMRWLPGLEQLYAFDYFSDATQIERAIALHQPRYLVIMILPPLAERDRFIATQTAAGRLIPVEDGPGFRILETAQ